MGRWVLGISDFFLTVSVNASSAQGVLAVAFSVASNQPWQGHRRKWPGEGAAAPPLPTIFCSRTACSPAKAALRVARFGKRIYNVTKRGHCISLPSCSRAVLGTLREGDTSLQNRDFWNLAFAMVGSGADRKRVFS